MDHVWSLLLLLIPWMGYGYTVIQVVCWVELLEQRRLPDFCENMDLDKWDIIVWYQVTQNPQEFNRLMSCQWDPRVLGRHKNMAHLFLENFTSEGIFDRNKP